MAGEDDDLMPLRELLQTTRRRGLTDRIEVYQGIVQNDKSIIRPEMRLRHRHAHGERQDIESPYGQLR